MMKKVMATTFSYVPAEEYEQQLIELIPHAKKRITLMVMDFTWGPHTARICKALLTAQRHGVSVQLVVDRRSFLPFAFGRQWPWHLWQRLRLVREFFSQLEAASGTVRLLGKTWSHNPFGQRQHAKITIVDDHVFAFGGVNFTDTSFTNIDYMLYRHDDLLANLLQELVEVVQTPPATDQFVSPSPDSEIIFDGGQRGTSAIYDRACALTEQASRVHYVSQMCPSGRLVTALRGKTTYYFNRPAKMPFPANIALLIDQLRYGIKNSYKGSRYIHAKFMLFEMPDGNLRVLSGSHNFNWRGVAYGTKEIVIDSSNAALCAQFKRQLELL